MMRACISGKSLADLKVGISRALKNIL